MSTAEILEKAKELFFEAMVSGYANPKTKKTTLEGLPGSKVILFEKDEFKVTDMYFTYLGSDLSSGMTIIHYQNKPIWTMHYEGWYKEEVIPFLKEVLHVAYQKGYFSGGRGINPFQSNSFLYINKFERNEFEDFKGREEIYSGDGRFLGYHEYFGESLLSR